MKKFIFFICLTALCIEGCAAKWSLSLEPEAEPARWFDDSNVARATYVGSIRGFEETGQTISNALKYIVFGNRARENKIVRPVAVAIAPDGSVAIADPGVSAVHLFVPAQQQYRKIFAAGKEVLGSPVGVAFDEQSRLYVSDSSRRAIYVFGRDGAFSFSIKKAGGDALMRPTGLSYAAGTKTLYAVDTIANKIYAFNTSGALLFSFGGRGEGNTQFNFPTHIATGPDGKVYVVDAMNFRVQVFDSSGGFITSFGHHGNGSGDFAMPKGIAVDGTGVIYTVDTLFENIQLFDLAGRFLFTIGRSGPAHGEFSMPSGIFLDGPNKLYVCDTYNQRVQIFHVTGNKNKDE